MFYDGRLYQIMLLDFLPLSTGVYIRLVKGRSILTMVGNSLAANHWTASSLEESMANCKYNCSSRVWEGLKPFRGGQPGRSFDSFAEL
jgi:hypothetical protein